METAEQAGLELEERILTLQSEIKFREARYRAAISRHKKEMSVQQTDTSKLLEETTSRYVQLQKEYEDLCAYCENLLKDANTKRVKLETELKSSAQHKEILVKKLLEKEAELSNIAARSCEFVKMKEHLELQLAKTVEVNQSTENLKMRLKVASSNLDKSYAQNLLLEQRLTKYHELFCDAEIKSRGSRTSLEGISQSMARTFSAAVQYINNIVKTSNSPFSARNGKLLLEQWKSDIEKLMRSVSSVREIEDSFTKIEQELSDPQSTPPAQSK